MMNMGCKGIRSFQIINQGQMGLKKFVATLLIVNLLSGCKTTPSEPSSQKAIYGTRSSWVFWSKGVFVDVIPRIHRAKDGAQTQYFCAYYGEGDPKFKPTQNPEHDLKTVWATYESGTNRWQSKPLAAHDLKKSIESSPDTKNSKIGFRIAKWIGAPLLLGLLTGGGGFIVMLGVYGMLLNIGGTALVYTVGGVIVGTAVVYEASDIARTKGHTGQIVDQSSSMYDPEAITQADADLDFSKLLKILKNVPPMPAKDGIRCQSPTEVLNDLHQNKGLRDILNWRAPEISSGVTLSCANLNQRQFIISRAENLLVKLRTEKGTTISSFPWDELNDHLRREGTILSNLNKFQSAKSGIAGDTTGLEKYVQDNSAISAQYQLMTNAVLSGNNGLVTALNDLSTKGDIVDETCEFIKMKL
jgi:hypothetical protein